MDQYALSIDCGTSGIRALIFNDRGDLLAEQSKKFEGYYTAQPGYYEAPADMFWQALCTVVRELKKNEPDLFSGVTGVTVSCQRDTATIFDEKGQALRDFIVWPDRRELDQPMANGGLWDLLFKLPGKGRFLASLSKTTHGHWIMTHEPELWKKAATYGLLSTYLIGQLTGRVQDCYSDIAGHLPFDYKKKAWISPHNIETKVVHLDLDKMPSLGPSCEILGYLTAKAADETGLPEGLPVIGSGTDKACETLGVGCVSPDMASVSLGTQATVETTTPKYCELELLYPPFPGVDDTTYNPEITVYRGFWMIQWFIENFAQAEKAALEDGDASIYEVLDRKLREIPPGSEGLVLHPYWGMDSFRPNAIGSMFGFNERQNKFHIYRAIIEGIGYALREGLDRIQAKTKVSITRVGLSGGGACSDPVCQIMADIFGLEVFRVQTPETTGLGAAMAVFVGLGRYENLSAAKDHMVRESTIWQPDPEASALYDQIYHQVYLKALDRYKPLYQRLAGIFKKKSMRTV